MSENDPWFWYWFEKEEEDEEEEEDCLKVIFTNLLTYCYGTRLAMGQKKIQR